MAKILVILICSLSIFTLIICALDKYFAIKHKRRVPEAVLIVLSAAGGSLGMLIGMYLFHHKTKKPKFFLGVPLIIVLQIILCAFLYYKGII